MSISLTKGENLNLTKTIEPEKFNELTLGLGWNPRKTDGKDFDLDAAAFLLKEDGKIFSTPETSACYFNQKTIKGLTHGGDNRTGQGDGDDEQLVAKLSDIPEEVKEILFVAFIFDAKARGQNFGQVEDAYIRLVNPLDGNKELARYDLTEDYSNKTAIDMGKLYRYNGEWKFKAIGEGTTETVEELFARVGAI